MNGLIWKLALVLSFACATAGVLLLPAGQRGARVETRIRSIRRGQSGEVEVTEKKTSISTRALSILGQVVLRSGIFSGKALDDLKETVAASGYRSSIALPTFVGLKAILAIGLPVAAWVLIDTTGIRVPPLVAVGACGILGLMGPDFVIRSARKRYLRAVESGMPAALDLMIICAEAGMALEAGFERVSLEAAQGAPATANELRITAMEMKLLTDRGQALMNMGKRTGLDSMTRLAAVLIQSMKYGTPLAQALRLLSAEMRQTMLNRFEARAARIPTLLTIPMVVFILPCIFIVVGGPAALQVIEILAAR